MRVESGGTFQLRGKVTEHARREHTCTNSCFERVSTAEDIRAEFLADLHGPKESMMPSQSQIDQANVIEVMERRKAQRKAEKESMMLTDAERRAELPVEHELVDGALYGGYGLEATWLDGEWEFDANLPSDWQPAFRYAPVARYEPLKPETPEPTGLGAVVRGAGGEYWVKTDRLDGRWYCAANGRDLLSPWLSIPQPVKVLSEGVEL